MKLNIGYFYVKKENYPYQSDLKIQINELGLIQNHINQQKKQVI